MKATVTDKGNIHLEAENEAENFILKRFLRPNKIVTSSEGISMGGNTSRWWLILAPIQAQPPEIDALFSITESAGE